MGEGGREGKRMRTIENKPARAAERKQEPDISYFQKASLGGKAESRNEVARLFINSCYSLQREHQAGKGRQVRAHDLTLCVRTTRS